MHIGRKYLQYDIYLLQIIFHLEIHIIKCFK